MEFGHDALEVGEINPTFPGPLFEQCELVFGGSLAVWVVVSTVKNVPEFLDGVEVDSVVDDVRVYHSVSIAFEKGREVHHQLVLVIAELPGIAYQFRL